MTPFTPTLICCILLASPYIPLPKFMLSGLVEAQIVAEVSSQQESGMFDEGVESSGFGYEEEFLEGRGMANVYISK